MENIEKEAQLTREDMHDKLVRVLGDMTADWDLQYSDAIGPETMLRQHLEFESIDVVQLVVALEEEFETRAIPFSELIMSDGRYVDDLSVDQIVEFLSRHFSAA